jgi:hypothetical protein
VSLWDTVKKKGFKINLLKIPTRRTPAQVDHKVRTEFQRARVIRTLKRVKQACDSIDMSGWSPETTELKALGLEVSALIRDLESYEM